MAFRSPPPKTPSPPPYIQNVEQLLQLMGNQVVSDLNPEAPVFTPGKSNFNPSAKRFVPKKIPTKQELSKLREKELLKILYLDKKGELTPEGQARMMELLAQLSQPF